MTDTSASITSHPASPDRLPGIVVALAVLLACALLTGLCWLAAGPTLGFFLGPPALLAIVLPQLVSVVGRARYVGFMAILTAAGAAAVWFAILPDSSDVNARQVSDCSIVLASLALLLVGGTDALLWSGIRPTAASSVVSVVFLGWLTWPIWLSAHLTGHFGEVTAGALVWAHPLFAMNSVLHFDLWDHYPFMYSTLSSLNQDVAYQVPRSVWPAVLIHGISGAMLLGVHPLIARQLRARALLATPPNVR